MREVLSMMPEVKPPHNRCCRCGDKIVPRLWTLVKKTDRKSEGIMI